MLRLFDCQSLAGEYSHAAASGKAWHLFLEHWHHRDPEFVDLRPLGEEEEPNELGVLLAEETLAYFGMDIDNIDSFTIIIYHPIRPQMLPSGELT